MQDVITLQQVLEARGVENAMEQTYAAIDQLLRLVVLDVLHAAVMAAVFALTYALVRKLEKK